MLHSFGPDLHYAEGPVITAAGGFRFPTRMAVLRLDGGGLWIWSPIPLTAELRAAIETLGLPQALVAPNHLHDSWLDDWVQAYPQAEVHLAPGLPARHPELTQAQELGDAAPDAWAGQIDQLVLRGNAITTEVLFFHRASGAVLVTDLLQNYPAGWFPGWRGVVARLDGMVGPAPRMPRKFRLGFLGHRRMAGQAARLLLDWPITRLLVAHGTPVEQGARGLMHREFGWLFRRG